MTMLKGTYTLVIKLHRSRTLTIGRLGCISFVPGYYAYVGSALNGLQSRISRHLREDKVLHWHVDYLLRESKIVGIFYGITEKNKECSIAAHLNGQVTAIPHFGCSDCSCKSHLFFCRDRKYIEEMVTGSFKKSGLSPKFLAKLE